MNENVNDDQQKLFNADKAQLKELMQVINQIQIDRLTKNGWILLILSQ